MTGCPDNGGDTSLRPRGLTLREARSPASMLESTFLNSALLALNVYPLAHPVPRSAYGGSE